MLRKIKKSVKYFIIIIGIIIIFPMVLYPLISIPYFQTLLLNRITNHFSNEIKSTISVGKVELVFFKNLNLDDVLIKDNNNDTLIYAHKITAGIKTLDWKNKSYTLGRINLINPVMALITDSTGMMNLKWYLDLLKQPQATAKTGSTIIINQVNISNGRFSLINKKGERGNIPVDFNNLHLSGVYGTVEDFNIRDDSTYFGIYSLSFRESGGFMVRKMSSNVVLADNNIIFSSATVNCDSSLISIPRLELHPDSSGSYGNFIKNVRLDILLDKSLVSFSDLQYFVVPVKGMDESVTVSGRVYGTVSELRGRNIKISYRENSLLDCDFDLSGLPETENTFIYIGVNELKTNSADIEKTNIPGKGFPELPEYFDKLGTISFNGSFTGFMTDFVAYGTLNSDAGNLRTDVSFRPEGSNRFKIKGLVNGTSIALGQISGKTGLLGNLTMRANVDMYAYSLKSFSGGLTGLIDSVEINGYEYRDISLSGTISEKTWDGTVKVSDDNIKMDILGMFNFSGELPEFDFTLNLAKADLYKLHVVKADTTAAVSVLLTANFKGDNIDNLDGEIKLLNSSLRKYGNILELYDFSIRSFTENNQSVISLRTDYVDADVRGNFNLGGLSSAVSSTLARLLPSRYAMPKEKNEFIKDRLTFSVSFKNTDKINNFLKTGILLSEKSIFNGEISSDSIVRMKWNAKKLQVRSNVFSDLSVEANLLSSVLSAELRSSTLNLMGQYDLKGFSADLDTKPDNFVFNTYWDNREEILNRGNFIARGTYVKDTNENSKPVLMIDIDSTGIYTRNNLWKISHSTILIDSNYINLNKLLISNKEHYYLINGTLSENPADTLNLEFKGIDISPLNYFITNKKEPDQLDLGFKGELSGKVLLTDIYHNPMLESNLKINGFSMLENNYGDLSLISAWNKERKVAEIRAGNNFNGKKMIDIAGHYNPARKTIELTAGASQLPITALNPLLKSFASGITGSATGRVKLAGELNKLVLKGALMVENGSLKIDYLQTRYRINDSIRFDKNNILFKNVRLTDEKGNPATLGGSVRHEYFREYNADLMISFNDCMVLNTKPKDNEMFYGIAYGTGVTTLKAGPDLISFDISAKTGRNTRFYMPLTYSATVSDYSFITFVSNDTTAKSEITPANIIPKAVAQTGIELNFDLEVTPDAEVQLIFDEKVGDVIRGHGYGNLNINLNRKGDLRISGDYVIEDGEYMFTLGNILNKPFSVENGGKITFNGDVDNAEIDMKAIYRLKASLNEILMDEKSSERIPVECQINLSGKLFNPIVGLNIDLPSATEDKRAYLRNVITTEEEMNRQFLYLLVMNSFYYSGTKDPASPETTTAGMAVTTTEMLSNQLSNWLSQISQDFDVGFVYRPGYKQFNAQEVEVALSTQLLNDKVMINGNFGVRGTEESTGNNDKITGDFDIEYKVTEKIRFKFFNRFNNPYTGKQAQYTQGFGLFFREDFDKFSDLFRRKAKSEMKKEEEPEIMQ